LTAHVLPGIGEHGVVSPIRVFKLVEAREIYRYEDGSGRPLCVGKFYSGDRGHNASHAPQTAGNEYRNLRHMRSLGFDAPPCYVVRPLGYNPDIGNVLVLEHLEGEPLSDIIAQAAHQGRHARLYRKLAALAASLASMHNRTAGDHGVNMGEGVGYLHRVVDCLLAQGVVRRHRADELRHWTWVWSTREIMWTDRSVLIHGDATPSNFLFGQGAQVRLIDLERMRRADRASDLGRLAGELRHCFIQATGDSRAAEPFIGHFLWEYASHFPDHERAFHHICARIPFYMGTCLLRIARNPWLEWGHRRRLAHEARAILKD
jgi:aminoglycoside phosphotransferase (APT) family kinase protein